MLRATGGRTAQHIASPGPDVRLHHLKLLDETLSVPKHGQCWGRSRYAQDMLCELGEDHKFSLDDEPLFHPSFNVYLRAQILMYVLVAHPSHSTRCYILTLHRTLGLCYCENAEKLPSAPPSKVSKLSMPSISRTNFCRQSTSR